LVAENNGPAWKRFRKAAIPAIEAGGDLTMGRDSIGPNCPIGPVARTIRRDRLTLQQVRPAPGCHSGTVSTPESRQAGACTIDAALDRAHRAVADFRGFLVGEAGCSDQNQRFALIGRQLQQRLAELVELDVRGLLFARRQRSA
jgi:hypothetical protein